jgi:hypothetical protein
MKLIRGKNDRFLLLTPRSASHSFAAAALEQWHPEDFAEWQASGGDEHPARYLPNLTYPIDCQTPAIIVRNPVERFRSACGQRKVVSVEGYLKSPPFGVLSGGSLIRPFLFESQLQACADWLGITVPLPQLDATDESDKPTLTPEQESRIREFFAVDIALWESLQVTR